MNKYCNCCDIRGITHFGLCRYWKTLNSRVVAVILTLVGRITMSCLWICFYNSMPPTKCFIPYLTYQIFDYIYFFGSSPHLRLQTPYPGFCITSPVIRRCRIGSIGRWCLCVQTAGCLPRRTWAECRTLKLLSRRHSGTKQHDRFRA